MGKKEEIATLTKQIALLESEIQELKDAMEKNKAAQGEATTVRNKENKAWKALDADLDGAIDQTVDAIKVLAEIGNDQTMEQSAADHEKLMAGYEGRYGYGNSLLNLKATVKQALLLASSMTTKHKQVLESFL